MFCVENSTLNHISYILVLHFKQNFTCSLLMAKTQTKTAYNLLISPSFGLQWVSTIVTVQLDDLHVT